MISTPDDFEPDLQAGYDDDAIAHVFVGEQLLQVADSPGWLPWAAYRDSGLQSVRTHVIGRHRGRVHIAVGLADDTEPASLRPLWRAGGLRVCQQEGGAAEGRGAVRAVAVMAAAWRP